MDHEERRSKESLRKLIEQRELWDALQRRLELAGATISSHLSASRDLLTHEDVSRAGAYPTSTTLDWGDVRTHLTHFTGERCDIHGGPSESSDGTMTSDSTSLSRSESPAHASSLRVCTPPLDEGRADHLHGDREAFATPSRQKSSLPARRLRSLLQRALIGSNYRADTRGIELARLGRAADLVLAYQAHIKDEARDAVFHQLRSAGLRVNSVRGTLGSKHAFALITAATQARLEMEAELCRLPLVLKGREGRLQHKQNATHGLYDQPVPTPHPNAALPICPCSSAGPESRSLL